MNFKSLQSKNMEEWLTEHWATLLAALGLGGGGSVVGHKMVDKIQNKKIEKYNELFKTLVAAGLLMPSAAGARWFGQMIARLNQEKPGWDQ